MTVFEKISNELKASSINLDAAELHGLLIGYTCGMKDTQAGQRRALYENWLGGEPSTTIVELLESAHAAALENLDEFSDFEFRLVLPAESAPIDQRVAALACWCSGFLSGLGESGKQPAELHEDTAEALADLARIAAVTDEVPEGEENEEDLAELEEFVRISVLLIFAESEAKRLQ